MSRVCCLCNKRPQVANMVSHANNRVKKWVYPNLKKLRFTLPATGSKVYCDNVCAKCIKARKVVKVI